MASSTYSVYVTYNTIIDSIDKLESMQSMKYITRGYDLSYWAQYIADNPDFGISRESPGRDHHCREIVIYAIEDMYTCYKSCSLKAELYCSILWEHEEGMTPINKILKTVGKNLERLKFKELLLVPIEKTSLLVSFPYKVKNLLLSSYILYILRNPDAFNEIMKNLDGEVDEVQFVSESIKFFLAGTYTSPSNSSSALAYFGYLYIKDAEFPVSGTGPVSSVNSLLHKEWLLGFIKEYFDPYFKGDMNMNYVRKFKEALYSVKETIKEMEAR